MSETPKHFYIDFITHRRRWTQGTFSHWTQGGILNVWYAVFNTGKGQLLIPHYLLAKETAADLPPVPDAAADAVEDRERP